MLSFLGIALAIAALIGCGNYVEGSPDAGGRFSGGSADDDAGAEPRRRGRVTMLSILAESEDGGDAGSGTFLATAHFDRDFPHTPANAPPPSAVRDPCRTDERYAPKRATSAGTIEIKIRDPEVKGQWGNERGVALLWWDTKKQAYSLGHYIGSVGRPRFDVPGSAINVSAAGNTVPAFGGVTYTAGAVAFHEPPFDLRLTPRSEDIAVRWTSTDSDDLFVALNLGEHSVSCTFDASTGSGVIPAALVRKVVNGFLADGGESACTTPACASIMLASMRSTDGVAGDYDIVLTHGAAVWRKVSVVP